MKKRLTILCLLVLAASVAGIGCKRVEKKAEAHPSPAKVAAVQQEVKLNDIVLTPEAEQRLGITYATVETKPISRVRSYAGEIALPPGASLVISAPVGGKLEAASSGNMPAVGMLVSANQPLFLLTPLLSPEREVLTPAEKISIAQTKSQIITMRIEAAGQVMLAKNAVDKAKLDLDRAQRLLRDSAGTKKAVDDAQAALVQAQSTLDAAQDRQKAVDTISLDGGDGGQQTPLVLRSPQAGMIRTLNAAPGEDVASGAPLFEVMKYDPVWLRVPVYAGETAQLALDQPAEVVPLNAEESSRGVEAQPIAAPPSATPLAATVDLYYQLANPEGRLRPGERMTVRVKLQGASDQRVVPWSAIMHDINGGTWVYENTAPHTFVRRRVQVKFIVDDLAALESGPATGAKIVTAGAVELYGTEFGFAK